MKSNYELTLKGYFEELRESVNKNYSAPIENSAVLVVPRLLNLVKKAVGTIEEVYEKDANLLHKDNAFDYHEMIQILNEQGINYSGNVKILELTEQSKTFEIEKLPMQKATGKKKGGETQQGQQKTG